MQIVVLASGLALFLLLCMSLYLGFSHIGGKAAESVAQATRHIENVGVEFHGKVADVLEKNARLEKYQQRHRHGSIESVDLPKSEFSE